MEVKETKKHLPCELTEEEIGVLARKIQNGYEFRDVDCEIQFLENEKAVQIVRLDTGQVIEKRAMTPDELQKHLFEEEPPEEGFEEEKEANHE